MSLRIDQDHSRFRNIVRGRIRQNLRKYISKGELLGRQGKDIVSIPIPHIDIPKLRFGDKQQGGVAQGEGDPGDPLSGSPQEGDGQGKAGDQAGDHPLEVELTLDELADILGEELALPNIENKGKSAIVDKKDRYVGVRSVGPNSLRHFRRTFRSALRRQIALGTYNPKRPVIIPTRDDMRYKSWKTEEEPVANAVIIYMMDVSGSMGDEQKEIVRIESFWIDTWLRKQYKGIETRFVIHDAAAREVDRDTFFRTRESGRHDDLLGVPPRGRHDRARLSFIAVEHLSLSISQMATTGASTTRCCASTSSRSCCSPLRTCFATAKSIAPTAPASSSKTSRSTSRRTSS